MARVLLVCMPYGALGRPSLGLSLLKPQLAARGIECDLVYPNFDFAELIGEEAYRHIGEQLPHVAFAGEWTFAEVIYGPRPEADAAYIQTVLRDTWGLSDDSIQQLLQVRRAIPEFLNHCLNTIPWSDYEIVGFTSTFEQNLPSLALAGLVKRHFPTLKTVFGGANWEGEMGLELHRRFPFVDYVCSGEADESFPALVTAILAGESVADVPGLVYRKDDVSHRSGKGKPVRTMDALPTPDFGDYFERVARSSMSGVVPTVLMETSRGCWWGERSHCTFCGLNGNGMVYRSKSAPRARAELEQLVTTWSVNQVEIVDNIMDMKYFRNFLAELAQREPKLYLFYEIKANLKRKQVKMLADAGVTRVQPGIESLNDHVLKLMRKGTTTLQNLQLLKWCKSFGVSASWNLLFGFPGETVQDYEAILELLPKIHFLEPPVACARVRLDRFSPFFNDADGFGFERVRPMAAYPYLYPFEEEQVARIAYYFEYDHEPEAETRAITKAVTDYVARWQQREEGSLYQRIAADGSLLLVDTRAGRPTETRLNGLQKDIYLYCDEARSLAAIMRWLKQSHPAEAVEESGLRSYLDSLVANGLMLFYNERYFSLALTEGALEPLDGKLREASTSAA